jgi:hypothetical protein
MLHQLLINFKDPESTLFDIKFMQEIIVAPMRDYIENWLKQALIKITEEDQEEIVGIDRVTTSK